ncbi:MAG: threonine synthase [Oscillospiraceae bacterium]|nr:threonine synthase [Oscillospiraceae bacterium]
MHFVCGKCGKKAATDTRSPRCDCGGLWSLEFEPPKFSMDKIDLDRWGIFRYRKFMALESEVWRDVTMGEGETPVIRLDNQVLLKMEYCMPTLSFKDRGAAVLISHCKAIGVDSVVQDSSGNAGGSIAAYAARAGIRCEIFVPEGTPPKKIAMIEAYGAKCTVVPGGRDRCAEVCREKAVREGVYYASHVFNPFFYEGTKTYIYEILEQMGHIPEHLLFPVGNGTLFLGAMRALEHLLDSGAIPAMPQVIAVQSEGCDPLLRAAQAGKDQPEPVTPTPTMAEGIAIGQPLRGEEILAYAKKHGVHFVHAPEDQILSARAQLARRGVYCEHTTAASYAAFLRYCKEYGPVRECLIPMCGAGLKSDH